MAGRLDRLWAPWRYEFIKKAAGGKHKCFFCAYARASERDESNLVVYRGKSSFCVLNKFPYSVGHVMVAPYRHVPSPAGLSSGERAELIDLVSLTSEVLRKKMKSPAFNVGANIGREAGAGVPGHIHFHVVPRWSGDTNFMPVLSGTKVMVASLKSVYKLLRSGYNRTHEKHTGC